MPRPKLRPRLRPLWRPLASYALFLLGGVVLLRMDPFGFTRLTKFYSQDLLAVAMAGCYPDARVGGKCVKEVPAHAADAGEPNAETVGRAATSVVLLRDADLTAFSEPWPPRYGFHARILRAIRANKPKAVMMDIVFEDVRDDPTIEALAAELDRYKDAGIPIYAATFGPDRPLRPGVAERVKSVQVPKAIDPLDRVTRFYELATSEPSNNPKTQPTAVPLVFRDVCDGCTGEDSCDAGTVRVFWSIVPDESFNDRWLECRRRPKFPWWIFQDRGSDFREDCPSTPTIPARILLEPTEEDDIAVQALIEDGVVFYGAFFHGAADAMNTPLHNDLPAVFLHSQTFDNLVTLGPEAIRHRDRQVPLLGVAVPDFSMLVVIGGIFTLRRTSRRFEEAWNRSLRRVRSRLGRVVLVALGSQIGMLILLAAVASMLACAFGASEWVLGVNFLFAVTWTEVLDITEKLFEAADELGPE
jgi:CHASE2 domain-containing sensor protein